MKILNKDNQSGRSMIEMLGVLAIIGVLSVGGISGYSKAMAKYKLTKAQDQITMLLMNVRTAYATSPNYANLTPKTAIEYNLAPNEMAASTASTGTLYGAFGGKVVVASCDHTSLVTCCGTTDTVTGSTYFGIKMEGLGKEACRSLATSDWGADGLVSIYVEGGSGKVKHTPSQGAIPLSATGLCSGETNTITWTYY